MCCMAIEDSQGRVRETPNGPRTIDLDIVDYEGVESSQEELVLPHPRALERDFVVTPLLDIGAGLRARGRHARDPRERDRWKGDGAGELPEPLVTARALPHSCRKLLVIWYRG